MDKAFIILFTMAIAGAFFISTSFLLVLLYILLNDTLAVSMVIRYIHNITSQLFWGGPGDENNSFSIFRQVVE